MATQQENIRRAGRSPKSKTKESGGPAPANEVDSLPTDFFDSSVNIKRDLFNIRLPSRAGKEDKEPVETAEVAPPEEDGEEKLPEGFFDDPNAAAKARNIEYQDPNDEERFQRVTKEATIESMAIISEEQEESTAERQISEIDKQIRNWSRVLSLEQKKDELRQRTVSALAAGEKRLKAEDKKERISDEEEDDDEDDGGKFEEFPDWRAKKSFK